MVPKITKKLLNWYDKEKRILPWRKKTKGEVDAYNVWVSEIMLQQTTVNAVISRYKKFISRFPNVKALAESPLEEVLEEWAGLGYYSRARNLHSSAKTIVNKYEGIIPSEENKLISLPGIGTYTSGAIRAIAFRKPSLAIDVNVERVITRLFKIDNNKKLKNKIKKYTQSLIPQNRPGDFAEALMDLGSLICKRANPDCSLCPLKLNCKGYISNRIQVSIKNKKLKTIRKGKCYIIKRLNDSKFLFIRNPAKGLLGSMLLFPTYGWLHSDHDDYVKSMIEKFIRSINRMLFKNIVRHEFSHFKLELEVYYIESRFPQITHGEWLETKQAGKQLPSVMKKVLDNI